MSPETSAFKLQTPGKFPEEYKLHSEHGESLKTTIFNIILTSKPRTFFQFFFSFVENDYICVTGKAHVVPKKGTCIRCHESRANCLNILNVENDATLRTRVTCPRDTKNRPCGPVTGPVVAQRVDRVITTLP